MLEPASAVAEACRTIRTAIHFGAPKDRCRTVLVTSPASSDGKSTIAQLADEVVNGECLRPFETERIGRRGIRPSVARHGQPNTYPGRQNL
jgi:hypothetical protein